MFFSGNRGKQRGHDVGMEMVVTLEELYSGVEKEVKLERTAICRKCRGTGAKNGKVRFL